jgi:uncharacterized protein
MRQVWHELLFAHWPIPVDTLRPLIPRDLEIDAYAGEAWLGIVPFRMSGVRPRGTFGIAELRPFPELNVRTYVVRDGKPGVWFFSLDAAHRLAVFAARSLFHLPYFFAAMSSQLDPATGWISYVSHRREKDAVGTSFEAKYRPVGTAFTAQPGTIEHFLIERYCLYAAGRKGRTLRCEIHHPAWNLQMAESEFEANTMAAAAGLPAQPAPPRYLHFARRQEVVVWPPHRVAH